MNALPPPAPAAPDARAQAALWADALHALQLLALAPARLLKSVSRSVVTRVPVESRCPIEPAMMTLVGKREAGTAAN